MNPTTILTHIFYAARAAHEANDLDALEQMVNLIETATKDGGSYGMRAEQYLYELETKHLI